MIMPPGTAGTYLIHFTGSKDHNVQLRGRARDRGWSLSENGFLRIGDDGEPLTGDAAELRTFPTETEAYRFLDLDFVEPELREDRGEVEAAAAGTLPDLVELADLRGDLHSHSDWSDGVHSIELMAETARARGHAYQVLTDHSQSLAIARGLTPDRVELQRAVVAGLNARFAAEEAAGRAPEATPAEGFRLLHGCELEIRADGRLDYEDELLARFDLVVASLHVGRRQPRAQLTARVLSAIRSPHVDVIAHPAGRMIQSRDDLDLDWEAIYAEAARTGTVLEMNGSDHRLDLSDERARRALAAGCLLALDSDAHRIEEFHNLDWAVAAGPPGVGHTGSRPQHPLASRSPGLGRREAGATRRLSLGRQPGRRVSPGAGSSRRSASCCPTRSEPATRERSGPRAWRRCCGCGNKSGALGRLLGRSVASQATPVIAARARVRGGGERPRPPGRTTSRRLRAEAVAYHRRDGPPARPAARARHPGDRGHRAVAPARRPARLAGGGPPRRGGRAGCRGVRGRRSGPRRAGRGGDHAGPGRGRSARGDPGRAARDPSRPGPGGRRGSSSTGRWRSRLGSPAATPRRAPTTARPPSATRSSSPSWRSSGSPRSSRADSSSRHRARPLRSPSRSTSRRCCCSPWPTPWSPVCSASGCRSCASARSATRCGRRRPTPRSSRSRPRRSGRSPCRGSSRRPCSPSCSSSGTASTAPRRPSAATRAGSGRPRCWSSWGRRHRREPRPARLRSVGRPAAGSPALTGPPDGATNHCPLMWRRGPARAPLAATDRHRPRPPVAP